MQRDVGLAFATRTLATTRFRAWYGASSPTTASQKKLWSISTASKSDYFDYREVMSTSSERPREVDPLLKDLSEKKQNFRRNVVSLAAELKDVRGRLASQEQTFARETLTRQACLKPLKSAIPRNWCTSELVYFASLDCVKIFVF